MSPANEGGIETYQQHIKDIGLYDVSFLYPSEVNNHAVWCLDLKGQKVIEHKLAYRNTGSCYQDPLREKLFENLLEQFKINLVHFQHLLWYPLSLPLVAKSLKIPTIYTLHDFFLVCQKFTLVGLNNRFCDIFNESVSQCDFCLQATNNSPFGTQAIRRQAVSKTIDAFDAVISNTDYTKSAFTKIYPNISSEKLHVIEMLTPEHPSQANFNKKTSPPVGPLKVVVPGNFTLFKGAETVLRLIKGLAGTNIQFTILGNIQEETVKKTASHLDLKNVQFIGGYSPSDAVDLMKGQDVSLHLSIWPETYMIALSEAWQAGAVPIVSDLGAPSERVIDSVNGFIVPPHSLGKIKDILEMLSKDRSKLVQMQQHISAVKLVTPQEHLSRLRSLYAKHLN